MKCTIYHNQKCSKSRASLDLLHSKGLKPTIIEYLNNPPTVEELEEIIIKLNIHPKQLIRFKEDKAKELASLPVISLRMSSGLQFWLRIRI